MFIKVRHNGQDHNGVSSVTFSVATDYEKLRHCSYATHVAGSPGRPNNGQSAFLKGISSSPWFDKMMDSGQRNRTDKRLSSWLACPAAEAVERKIDLVARSDRPGQKKRQPADNHCTLGQNWIGRSPDSSPDSEGGGERILATNRQNKFVRRNPLFSAVGRIGGIEGLSHISHGISFCCGDFIYERLKPLPKRPDVEDKTMQSAFIVGLASARFLSLFPIPHPPTFIKCAGSRFPRAPHPKTDGPTRPFGNSWFGQNSIGQVI